MATVESVIENKPEGVVDRNHQLQKLYKLENRWYLGMWVSSVVFFTGAAGSAIFYPEISDFTKAAMIFLPLTSVGICGQKSRELSYKITKIRNLF